MSEIPTIAVFDQFYDPSVDNNVGYDLISDALTLGEEQYTVIEHQRTLRAAMRSLVAMHQGRLAIPETVIVDAHLDGEDTYPHLPTTFPSLLDVESRDFLLRRKTKTVQATTHVLPILDTDGKASFPVTVDKDSAKPPNLSDRFKKARDRRYGSTPLGAYLLSHSARILLPEEVKIIGIYNGFSDPDGLPLDASIDRYSDMAARRLRDAIR